MTEDLRLSVSKTKTFLDCKAKFKFCYVEKLPRKEWDFHIFGKFCHSVLEYFHKQYIGGCTLPYNTVMTDAFKFGLSEFKEKMTPEMKKECWDLINQYLKIVLKDQKNGLPANVIDVEKRFDFAIHENLVLNGAIDRIQLDADNIVRRIAPQTLVIGQENRPETEALHNLVLVVQNRIVQSLLQCKYLDLFVIN